MNSDRACFSVNAASLLALSALAFHSKYPLVFYRFDGTYLLIVAAMERTWGPGGIDFGSNPLQGLGGFGLFWHTRWDPALWLAVRLPAWLGPTVAMMLYAAMLAATICWLAVRLGLPAVTAVAAAWIGLLLALPYVYPSLGFDFLWGVPADIPFIALNTAAILLFLDIGRGSRAADAARLAGLAGACGWQILQVPGFAPVSLIEAAFFGLVALLAAETPRERLIKLAVAFGLALLAALAFGKLLYGMWGFNKATFFWYEFFPRATELRDQSFLIAYEAKWPARLVYGLALAGALHAALRGARPMRALGAGFLFFVLGSVALLALIGNSWRGPRVAYVDIFAFPFYCVFAAHAGALVLGQLQLRFAPLPARVAAGGLVLSALPWLALIDYWPPPLERPLARNINPFIWPPAETATTRFLASEIGMRPGSPFRGRVASVAGTEFEPQWAKIPFISQHNFDALSLFLTENDHRMYGLWYYNIPTLFEANQFTSPFFHLVNARLLNSPGTIDTRSYETQSIANDRVMALLGVRYLITSKPVPGRTPAHQHRMSEHRSLHVYSIPNSNLAGYAVTRTREAADAQQVIAWLADPSIDLRDEAILTTPESLPPLAPASDANLVVERGGYKVQASSPGTSLLVLSVEYSHCLRAQLSTTGERAPRLLRANLTMTAILFSGTVEGTLQLRYGALSSGCRFEDWRDADALRIGDVREWPQPR